MTLKSEVGLNFSELRRTKRCLKPLGIHFENEQKEREIRDDILKDRFTSEYLESTDKSNENMENVENIGIPLVYIPDLCGFVFDHLNALNSEGLFHTRDLTLPSDEVWIKLGGDHGGDIFKVTLQVLNKSSPNSKDNTIVIMALQGKDTVENVQMSFEKIESEIKKLQNASWNNKKIRLFLCGDYQFLCCVYGIQGATSSFPCLWCNVPKSDIQAESKAKSAQLRTLHDMSVNLKEFLSEGKGKKSVAKDYFNVVREPVLPIALDQVVPPYLHIMLGIIKRHHDFLEEDVRKLDMKIGNICAVTGKTLGTTAEFRSFIVESEKYHKMKNEKKTVVAELESATKNRDTKQINQLKQRYKELDEEIPLQRPGLT